jgi:ADP-dependent NAD(P)H-hydrate dehydratase / NAD(P)H-hydrate epimerase
MTPLSGLVLTAAEMYAAEQTSGIALSDLMDRAGCALADAVWRFGRGAPTLILCGPGNNGGDGYVAARLLAAKAVPVRLAAHRNPMTELARAARANWSGPITSLEDAEPAPVLVDALFGTGAARPLAEPYSTALQRLAASATVVIAADLPSGLGTDDGADLGAVKADITIAFGAAKPAHLLQPGAGHCGHVLIADLGIGIGSNAHVIDRPALSPPTAQDHKYTRGMVVVIGGDMPGAGALAASAALCSGAGYVVGVGLKKERLPHAIVHRDIDVLTDQRVNAVVLGPGLGRQESYKSLIDRVVASSHALVLDGDALMMIDARRLNRSAPTIVTPHAGEFAKLFGLTGGSKIDRAREAAHQSRCTIVYKGSDTVIASPDGRITIAPPATPWLSTAGTGDVLAGIAGTMLARGLEPHEAACAAVWIHGEAARRAGRGLIADDLLKQLAGCW